MNEKKNIDRLFREKFKDFEVAPPERMWQNIEAGLTDKKKKRRVLPLWFRLSGVAALLAIGLLVFSPFTGGFDNTTNPVVIENAPQEGTPGRITPTQNPVHNRQTVTDTDNGTGNEAVVVNKTGTETPGSNDVTGATPQNTVAPGSSGAVAYGRENGTEGQGSEKVNGNATPRQETAVAASGRSTNGSRTNNAANRDENKSSIKTGAVNNASNREALAGNTQKAGAGKKAVTRNTDITATEEGLANNSNKAVAPGKDGNAPNNTATGNESAGTTEGREPITGAVIPVEEAMAQTEADSAAVPENELEKLLKEKLEGKKDKEALADNARTEKWNIKPQVAPVFYNSLSQGSPIDGQFAGNSKDFDNNLSYGVGIDYAINDRLSVRSGVNTVNLSYATNDIMFHASLNGKTPNVSTKNNTPIVVSNSVAPPLNPTSGFAAEAAPVQAFDGSLVQRTGYIEVPLEMSYALVNKKFGVQLIGGVSTLFLNENSVSVVSSQGLAADVGRAQNLNNVHFSTNVGIGFRYRFFKAFEANFEPTFKYQVNPFSSASGNFRPYFIGLYSGISFSF